MRLVCAVAALLAVSIAGAAEQWPQLRHTCYAVLLAPEGGEIAFKLQSIPKGTYPDWLQYALIDRTGEEVLWDQIRPGAQRSVSAPVRTPGLHVIEMSTGWNLATLAFGTQPWAMVVSDRLPLQTVGEVERLYFYVPAGVSEFSAFVSASVTGETVRLEIADPNSQVIAVIDGDVDKPEKLTVTVPEGQAGTVWSFSIMKAQTADGYVDDVMLHFSDNIPPYAAETQEAAVAFGTRGEQQ